jgi:hypothetical protein
MCKAAVPPGRDVCRECGWDAVHHRRCCILCSAEVVRSYGAQIGPIETVLASQVGAQVGQGFGVFGFSGSIAIGCLLSAVSCLYGAGTVAFRCKKCREPFPPHRLSDPEKDHIRMWRFGMYAGAGAMLMASVLFGLLWGLIYEATRPTPTLAQVEAWEKEGAAGVPKLMDALHFDSIDGEVVGALRRVGPPAVPALRKALGDDTDSVRYWAADLLSELAPEDASVVSDLLAAWRREAWKFRMSGALVKVGEPAAAGIMAALKDGDEETRRRAAEILGRLKSNPAVAEEALRAAAAGDSLVEVRREAENALIRLRQ